MRFWTNILLRTLFRTTYLNLRNTTHWKHSRVVLPITLSSMCFSWPFLSKKPPTLEQETSELLGLAISQIKQQDYEAADANLHLIISKLADARQANELTASEYTGRCARVFREMAYLQLCRGNHQMAETLLVETLRFAINSGMSPEDACVIEISLKLALLYSSLGEEEKASTGFEFCFHTQLSNTRESLEATSGLSNEQINDLALLGLVSNAYAHFFMQRGRFSDARDKLQMALQCAHKIYSRHHENCLHLVADLAGVECQLGDPDTALELLQPAIRKAESHPDSTAALVRLLCSAAATEASRGDFELANQWLEKATAAAAKVKDADAHKRALGEINSVREALREDRNESE